VNIDGIITSIDSEIARLQQARALIAAFDAPATKRRGRPKNVSAETVPSAPKKRKKRKPLSAEARARIAEAQKKRWAASKKSAN
jgi:putative N-acetylmannosamine-6-phosphate epimerase